MANRLSQSGVEVVLLPTSQQARLSQIGVETVYAPIPGALVSQSGVEVVAPVSAPASGDIISQVGVEVVGLTVGGLDPSVTQLVAERKSVV